MLFVSLGSIRKVKKLWRGLENAARGRGQHFQDLVTVFYYTDRL